MMLQDSQLELVFGFWANRRTDSGWKKKDLKLFLNQILQLLIVTGNFSDARLARSTILLQKHTTLEQRY